MQKRPGLAAAMLVVALTFVSCGGGDASVGDEEALEAMVVASVNDWGPEACLKYDTLHYLETSSHREGDAAVEACEEDALEPKVKPPTGVEVSQIDVDGGSATAVMALEGGVLDGQKVRNRFIERSGRWKYYEMLGFVDFDSQKLVTEMGREGMMQAKSPREARLIACVIGLMEKMSPESLEEQVFGDSEDIHELADSCAAGSATA